MSSTTWTPAALGSEAHAVELALWRAVEAQHIAATRALVDSVAEQELLETLLEAHKPPVPEPCAALDYLLFTPFRYPSGRHGSRFRDRGDRGVWYGADTVAAACAEVGYWRCRFVADSDGLTALDAVAHTLFRARAAGSAIDLRRPPLLADEAVWMAPDDYSGCRQLARAAREAGVALIRYRSVRDPVHAGCAAVLDCRAFAGSRGIDSRQTWFLSVDARRASWIRAGGGPRRAETLEFDFP